MEERFAFYERAKKAYAIIATGEEKVYANIISSYSLDPENKICVFDFKNDKLALKANYKGYTECPAGVFFTYNFE